MFSQEGYTALMRAVNKLVMSTFINTIIEPCFNISSLMSQVADVTL